MEIVLAKFLVKGQVTNHGLFAYLFVDTKTTFIFMEQSQNGITTATTDVLNENSKLTKIGL